MLYIAHMDKPRPHPHPHRYPHVHSPHPNVGSCARRHEPAQQEVPHWVAQHVQVVKREIFMQFEMQMQMHYCNAQHVQVVKLNCVFIQLYMQIHLFNCN